VETRTGPDAPSTQEALEACLRPTWFLDCDAPRVREFATRTIGDAVDPKQKATRLFYAVRDGIRYDPYAVSLDRDHYRASVVVETRQTFCVPKAILLAAAGRAVGLPTRLGFADVRNHLASDQLLERLGTDLFTYHGFTEIHLDGRWLKATSAFNKSMCDRFGVLPLDFDGTEDAVFHPFDAGGQRHMEYIRDRGSFEDFPFDEMIAAFVETYKGATRSLESFRSGGESDPMFQDEE
jgi:transglutaminase-like putative cysteine protease